MKYCIKLLICTTSLIFCTTKKIYAQDCGNCKFTPSVAQYDLDVQVSPPDSNANTGWLEWRQLFFLGRFANASLFNTNKKCIRFTQPSDDGTLKVGLTYVHVPPANKDVSQFGNYILTGFVKQSGNKYIMHMELQTACSRKPVAAAEVPFELSDVLDNGEAIAQQAVEQLSPLIEKINKFELEEREKNQTLSLFQTNWNEQIKITLQKSILKAGESTDFTIELKDCDGVPLQGREILFNATTFEGFKIHGTTGGTVTPAKVLTDANGTAKAKFTLKAGAKEAIINAHSPGNHVKGCASMFIGDALVNSKATVSGYVFYTYEKIDDCTETANSNVSTSITTWNTGHSINYFAKFYLDDEYGFSTLDPDPQSGDKISDRGSYKYNQYQKIYNKVGKNEPVEQVITVIETGAFKGATLRYTASKETPYVDLDIKFLNTRTASFKQTYMPSANNTTSEEFLHSFAAFNHDGKLKYNQSKNGNKTTHTFEYANDQTLKCTTFKEKIKLVIIEE